MDPNDADRFEILRVDVGPDGDPENWKENPERFVVEMTEKWKSLLL